MTDKDGQWFAAKRYGYGAGLPAAWQGWALLGGYLVLAALVARAMEERPALAVVLMLPATITLIAVTARKTRGGWRWRWGD